MAKPAVLFSRRSFSLLALRHHNNLLRHKRDKLSHRAKSAGLAWGILGALAVCGPTLVFSYVLLFKMKEKISFYAALPMTLITLGMGTMNLVAGAQNFQVFVDTAAVATGIRYGLLALIVTVNLVVPLTLKRMIIQPKSSLNLNKP